MAREELFCTTHSITSGGRIEFVTLSARAGIIEVVFGSIVRDQVDGIARRAERTRFSHSMHRFGDTSASAVPTNI